MKSILTTVLALMLVIILTVSKHGVAEGQNLLEIDVDDQGNITQVRGSKGEMFEPVPFKPIGQNPEEFDLVRTRSLLYAKASGQINGAAVTCCKPGGTWRSCLSGLAGTTMINMDGEVVEDGGTPEVPIESAVIEVIKSHAVAVVETGPGDRYGMVISADGMLYAPQGFTPTAK